MNEKKNDTNQSERKREKGLAAMDMMSSLPDDLVLCGSPETAPRAEKNRKENWFLRLMSSPVAAVVLSVCVAFVVVVSVIRAGNGRNTVNEGNPGSAEDKAYAWEVEGTQESCRWVDVGNFRFCIAGLEDTYTSDGRVSFLAYVINLGEPFTYTGYSFDFRADMQISGGANQQTVGNLECHAAIDTDETPSEHTVQTGEKSTFINRMDIPVRVLNGEGTYSITLTYNGVSAVFEDVFTVLGTDTDTEAGFASIPYTVSTDTPVISTEDDRIVLWIEAKNAGEEFWRGDRWSLLRDENGELTEIGWQGLDSAVQVTPLDANTRATQTVQIIFCKLTPTSGEPFSTLEAGSYCLGHYNDSGAVVAIICFEVK